MDPFSSRIAKLTRRTGSDEQLCRLGSYSVVFTGCFDVAPMAMLDSSIRGLYIV
ncbi:hypothetical protein EXIGLDRAFT_717692 [Exidia glandulosa HHB12029]|uniref:Uncharacterized protein n=1 Tax=Exidia glandulosa HHB12029 TaxID=1314781 RepID=A0A165I886_EXIGL|nr:hypothetical protein EXIGLDRAFT_717692 [Exidia glandulosa HHB12029]